MSDISYPATSYTYIFALSGHDLSVYVVYSFIHFHFSIIIIIIIIIIIHWVSKETYLFFRAMLTIKLWYS